MAQSAPVRPKINTGSTQPRNVPGSGRPSRRARGSGRVRGEARESARGRTVIELDAGITVYPPQEAGSRWRAVWTEDGRRRYPNYILAAYMASGT